MIARIRWILLAVLLSATPVVKALGYTGSFIITQLYISGPDNYQIRVSGFAAISACPSGPTWAYVNETTPGSKVYIAALMMAYTSGKPVNIVWQPDTNGFCRIIEIVS